MNLYKSVPLPIESVDFSAVKKVVFDIDEERMISNDFIIYVLRSSENLEEVEFGLGFEDITENISLL